MKRQPRVYRLSIDYPEGVDWRNPPETWECQTWQEHDGGFAETYFQWPAERLFLSRSGAQRRATRLRDYGCTVIVEASDPVVWP